MRLEQYRSVDFCHSLAEVIDLLLIFSLAETFFLWRYECHITIRNQNAIATGLAYISIVYKLCDIHIMEKVNHLYEFRIIGTFTSSSVFFENDWTCYIHWRIIPIMTLQNIITLHLFITACIAISTGVVKLSVLIRILTVV